MANPVNLTLHLTQDFVAELTQKHTDHTGPNDPNKIWAYLWYNNPWAKTTDASNNVIEHPIMKTIVQDGVLQGGAENDTYGSGFKTYDVSLQLTPDSLTAATYVDGGKVYLIVQSEPIASANHVDLTTVLTTEATINPGNALAYNFAYDTFEVSLKNASGDAGNLTAIDSFSRQLGVSVKTADGKIAARGYAPDVSAIDLDTKISTAGKAVSGGTDPLVPFPTGSTATQWHTGDETMLVMTPASYDPNKSTTHDAFKPEQWQSYVNAVLNETGIELVGYFNGAADAAGVYHRGGYFAYGVSKKEITADTTHVKKGTYFLLSPETSSQIKGYILVSADAMVKNLYKPGTGAAGGTAQIFVDADLTNPFNLTTAVTDGSMNTGENNQWGKVFTTFFTGFSGGYLGAEGHSIPFVNGSTLLPDAVVDLNKSYNWDPTYAFDGESNPVKARSDAAPTYMHFDPYAKVFFDSSNVYGGAYSDALTSKFKNSTLLPVYDPVGKNVSQIDLWAFGRAEKMDLVPGTTTPFYSNEKLPNFMAPTGSDYGIVAKNPALNLALNLTRVGMVIDPAVTEVQIGFYKGNGVFQYVPLPTGDAQKGGGFWQNWRVEQNGSDFVLQATPNATGDFDPKPVGTLVFNQFPSAASTVIVFQVKVGDRTFNVYAETDANGFFKTTAADGLATTAMPNTPDPSHPNFDVNIVAAELDSIAPAALVPNSSQDYLKSLPNGQSDLYTAPIAGSLNPTFSALAGQTGKMENALTLTGAQTLAFGWTGLNPIAVANKWIADKTNKIGALNTALVTVKNTDTGAIKTLSGKADIDGKWQTGTMSFADSGHFAVTMTEQLPGGQAYSLASNVLTLDITVKHALLGMAQVGTMTPDAINLLDFGGTHVINVVENTVTITLAQALALGSMIMHPADRVTVAGTGAEFAALTTAQIVRLGEQGADTIDATDDQMDLSLGQLLALGPIKLTQADDVTLRDTGAAIGALSSSFLAGLARRGVDALDATDDVLELTLQEVNRLGAVRLDPTDHVTVTASGLAISTLTVAQLQALEAKGVDELDATSGIVTMSLPRFEALGGMKLGADDRIVMLGGFGNDSIDVTGQPFGSDDLVLGGTGSDYYKLGASGAKVAELIFSGQDTIESSVSYVLPANVEALVLTGTGDINGTASNTSAAITGNVGNNVLTGRNGEDSLSGGDGNDTLVGGRGADELSGGAGTDAFRILGTKDGMDTILDFTGDDWIEIALAGFPQLGATGALGAGRFALDAPVGTLAQLVYDTATGLLAWDADGTGAKAATPLALLMGAPALTAADILVV